MNLLGLLFVGIGLFTIAGAWFDWDWFMNARKARFMVKILTRTLCEDFLRLLGHSTVGIWNIGNIWNYRSF